MFLTATNVEQFYRNSPDITKQQIVSRGYQSRERLHLCQMLPVKILFDVRWGNQNLI